MQTRTICEVKAGYKENQGFSNIDTVINKSWNKIFTTQVVLYNQETKERVCKKILKAYYLNEICAETVGVWMYFLNQTLEEIAPYYSELFKSADIEYDPLNNINYTETLKGENSVILAQTNDKNTTTNTDVTLVIDEKTVDNTNNHEEGINNHERLYSDTPQDAVSDIEKGEYLTNATFEKGGNTTNSTGNQNSSKSGNDTTTTKSIGNDIENVDKREDGSNKHTITKIGNSGVLYSEMIQKYRETILNIDSLIIKDFKDCFMIIY